MVQAIMPPQKPQPAPDFIPADAPDFIPADGAAPPQATGEMRPAETGVLPWIRSAQNDLVHGGGRTILGRVMGKMQGNGDKGYSGLESGVSPEQAQFMGSAPIGLAKIAEGGAEIPSHPMRGIWDAGKGMLQAATIPSAFMGGPVAEGAIDLIPSRAYAGKLFSSVMQDAAHQPVSLTRSLPILERAQQLSERGHGAIGAVDSLYKRINTVNPLNYAEARDRASALSGITAQDKMNATQTLRGTAKQLVHSFNEDVGDAATAAGRGEDYAKAMKEYANASKLRSMAVNTAKWGIGPTIGAGIGAQVLKRLIPSK